MTENKRFKIYDKETWDTYIEDTQDIYSDGTPKTYWFNENEDFCKLFDKLNEIADENEQLKSEIKKLETFKKILDFAEKDMEERADWQAYCEKEFEGL